MSALPHVIWVIRSTSIDFAENQLFPSLISLSPLAKSHPRVLQHTWVRSSKMCYHFFNLLFARSLGFGSNSYSTFQTFPGEKTLFMYALTEPPPYGLNTLYEFTRWPIMQKVHRHFATLFFLEKKCLWSFDCLSILNFRILFHSLQKGSFHLSLTVLVHYWSKKNI